MDHNNTPGNPPEELDSWMINVQAFDVQTSNMQPDGSYVVRLHVQIPPGVLKRQSTILTASGNPGNALQGALISLPEVGLHLHADKLTDAFIEQASKDRRIPVPSLDINPDAPEQ